MRKFTVQLFVDERTNIMFARCLVWLTQGQLKAQGTYRKIVGNLHYIFCPVDMISSMFRPQSDTEIL